MADLSQPIRDNLGHVHAFAHGDLRIASLSPAISGTLLALGLGERVIARTEDCGRYYEALAGAASLGPKAAPELEKLLALGASHALIDSADYDGETRRRLAAAGVEVIYTGAASVAGNFAMFQLLGDLFDRRPDADALARKLELSMARAKMAVRKARDLRIVYIDRLGPPESVESGSYVEDLFALVKMHVIGNEDGAALDLDGPLLLGANAVLFNGAKGLFKRSDLKAFAEAQHIDATHCLLLGDDPALYYGANAIAAIDELLALREKLAGLR